MSNPFIFSSIQNTLPCLRGGYKLPDTDVLERPLDTTLIPALTDTLIPGVDPTDTLRLPKDQSNWKTNWNNAGGQPIQLGDPSETIRVKVREKVWTGNTQTNTGRFEYEVDVPAPAAGYLWVQGNPQYANNLIGWSDCHARILNPDGSSTEMIKAVPIKSGGRAIAVEVDALGRYDPDGNLWDERDQHVTVWKEGTQKKVPATRISPLMLRRFEPLHRLAIVMKGNDSTPGDVEKHIGHWVGLPYSAVPWDDLEGYPDAQYLARCLTTHGAIIMDHSPVGSQIVEVTGGLEWEDYDTGGWAPFMEDFRLVDH